jgi:hypothetical protein
VHEKVRRADNVGERLDPLIALNTGRRREHVHAQGREVAPNTDDEHTVAVLVVQEAAIISFEVHAPKRDTVAQKLLQEAKNRGALSCT